MKRLKLSTQIIIIALVSIILIPTLVYLVAIPFYKRMSESSIFEGLNYQLTLNNTTSDDFLNSVFIIDKSGVIVSFDVKEKDQVLPVAVLNDIVSMSVKSELETSSGKLPLDDGGDVFYAYKVFSDGSVRLVLTCHFTRDTWFGNGQAGKFVMLILGFVLFPMVLVMLWFSYVSRSIKSIERSVAEDGQKPIVASKELLLLTDSIDVFKRDRERDNEEKQRLFQNISHELKTPITTIKMYAEGIEDGIYKDNDLKKSTAIIKEETDNLLMRVNKIMDINKLYHVETSAIKLSNEVVNLSEVIFETLELYNKRAPNIRFSTTLERQEWSGTKEIWSTILQNIFDNNIKHGAEHISISLGKSRLLIENDGDKVDEEIIETIFNPFMKGEKGNFGLGLNIIQRSLKLLGCKIEVKNTDVGVLYRIIKR